jgi:SsrA-binding protein
MKSPVYTYKKANYTYNIHDTYTAGIMLEGWEVKALDYHNGDINVSYCTFKGKNFILCNCIIKPDIKHVIDIKTISDKQVQERKLLLNKSEIIKIKSKIQIKGYTCIPLKLYRNNNGLWKLDIALVTGKSNYDKRNTLKEKDIKRDIDRNI